MSLKYTAEQLELQNSLRKFLATEHPEEILRARSKERRWRDEDFWMKLSSLGLFPYFSAPREGASFRDLSLVAFEEGRALVIEDLSASLLAGPSLSGSGAYQGVAHDQTSIQDGATRILPVWVREGELNFAKKGDSLLAHGEVKLIYGISEATPYLLFLVEEGGALIGYLGEVKSSGIHLSECDFMDLTRPAHSVKLDGAPVVSCPLPSDCLSRLRILKALELCGVADRVVVMTTEYVKTRKQFGVPVGGFQAVQHQLADMYLNCEAARALAMFAAWAIDNSPDQSAVSSRAAIAFATETIPGVIERAIQLHGGIGFTWEYSLHLYLRRAKSIERLWKSGAAEYAALLAAV